MGGACASGFLMSSGNSKGAGGGGEVLSILLHSCPSSSQLSHCRPLRVFVQSLWLRVQAEQARSLVFGGKGVHWSPLPVNRQRTHGFGT